MTPTDNSQQDQNPIMRGIRRYGQNVQQRGQQNFQNSPAGQIANWYQRRRQQQQQMGQTDNQVATSPSAPPPATPPPTDGPAPLPNAPGPASMAPPPGTATTPTPVAQDAPTPMPNAPGPASVEPYNPQPQATPVNQEQPGPAMPEQPPPPPTPGISSAPSGELTPNTGQAGAGQASPFMNHHQGPSKYFDDQDGQNDQMAQGGIVTQPTKAVLGENGPEAVIPMSPTANAKLHPTGFLKARYQRPTGPALAPGPMKSALPMSQNRTYR
jgi:hypothetical protein